MFIEATAREGQAKFITLHETMSTEVEVDPANRRLVRGQEQPAPETKEDPELNLNLDKSIPPVPAFQRSTSLNFRLSAEG